VTTVIIEPTFERRIKKLKKRYPRILDAVYPLIDELEQGHTPGDRLQGIPQLVYKVRLPNPDAQRGKSGGYRVIYYLQTADRTSLLLIYSKSDTTDIPNEEIALAIELAEARFQDGDTPNP
jgi:mRNA-degrading endonuclease RelE of RelBE toxin-antitoxin system